MASSTEPASTTILGRVGSILRSNRADRARSPSVNTSNFDHSKAKPNASFDEKRTLIDGSASPDSTVAPSTSRHDSSKSDAELDAHDRVRTLPPWIHSLAVGEDTDVIDPNAKLLPRYPSYAHHPQRNFQPESNQNAPAGRRFDNARSNETPIPSELGEHASRWRAFMQVSQYAYPDGERGQVVDEEWRRENFADLSEPWAPAGLHGSNGNEKQPGIWLFTPSKRRRTMMRTTRMLLNNPFVPLVIRVTVLTFVVIALGLGVTIYQRSSTLNSDPSVTAGVDTTGSNEQPICKQQASTYMAFIVSSIAVPYIMYITKDEYFSKPLGQRSSKDKTRLLFLDLIFIVFSAANLSIAFNTLTDQQWACYTGSPGSNNSNNAMAARSTCIYNGDLCRRQGALVGTLVVVLAAWLLTFAISIMRVVEKISK